LRGLPIRVRLIRRPMVSWSFSGWASIFSRAVDFALRFYFLSRSCQGTAGSAPRFS
jgi:hypothetical protein